MCSLIPRATRLLILIAGDPPLWRFPAGDHNARPELRWSPELARQNLTGCATAAAQVRRLWYGERHHAGQFIEEGPDGIEEGVRHKEDTPGKEDPDGAKPPAHEYEPE